MATKPEKPELLLPLQINPLDLLPEEEIEADNYDPTAKLNPDLEAAARRADAELASGQHLRP